MHIIEEKAKDIRDRLNNAWKKSLLWQDRVAWDRVFSSLDTIEDTQEAIITYQSLNEFDSNEGGYLYLYGLLQSIFVQQDACSNLHLGLFGKKINFALDYPQLFEIRNHRNLTTGHPTSKGKGKNESFTYISRISISKLRFKYLTYLPNNGKESKITEVDVAEIINNQSKNVLEILVNIKELLQSEWQEHKEKFMDKNLKDIVNCNLQYHMSKLYTTIGKKDEIVYIHFKCISDNYYEIKKAILERYHSTFAVQGLQEDFDMIEYLLDRIKRDLVDSQITDQKELRVFVNALDNHYKELVKSCEEIDEEFST